MTEEETPKVGEFGLTLRQSRVPNQYDQEAGDAAFVRFLSTYQQVVPSESNFKRIADFLHSRGAIANDRNLKIAFEQLWGHLELRTIKKIVEEPTTKVNKRGKTVAIDPYFFPKPAQAEIVEVVLSPAEVRALGSREMEKMMQPMQFASITSSANDYAKSAEFQADTVTQPRRSSQTLAQIQFEVKAFATAHPEYARYLGDGEKFGGL